MVATCSASFCQQELGAGVTWFLFPPQPTRKLIWMKRLQVKEDPQRPYMLACKKHFSEAQFRNSVSGKQLTSNAVPDMFIVEDEDFDTEIKLEEHIPSPVEDRPLKKSLVDSVCRLCLIKSDNLQSLFPNIETDDFPGPSNVLRTLGIKIEPIGSLPSGCCQACVRTIKSIQCVRQSFQETKRAMYKDFNKAVEAANRVESPDPAETQTGECDTIQLEVFEELKEGGQADDTELTLVTVDLQPSTKRSRLEHTSGDL
ncbi:uncharacterized protein LOC128738063 [Sabethes cyaneus]|uniref:uncharacterized protein LOC128738063 n=1 Tax=Sabethes cyaneus TaxID=53552 RepID=UPI00237E4298|nr:uncharacterized protein LOC128738063 [Sabethes cyaneus]